MRLYALIAAAAAACAAPAVASAYCFTMYDGQNRLTYQSQTSPVDLSLPISQAMARRYPGQSLVMSMDASNCSEYDGRSPDISGTGDARQPAVDSLVRALDARFNTPPDAGGDYIGATATSTSRAGTRVPLRNTGGARGGR